MQYLGYFNKGSTTITSHTSSKAVIIDVLPGQSYHIEGRIWAYICLYNIVDKHGVILSSHDWDGYGDTSVSPTDFSVNINIPMNGAQLLISFMNGRKQIIELISSFLPIENRELLYNEDIKIKIDDYRDNTYYKIDKTIVGDTRYKTKKIFVEKGERFYLKTSYSGLVCAYSIWDGENNCLDYLDVSEILTNFEGIITIPEKGRILYVSIYKKESWDFYQLPINSFIESYNIDLSEIGESVYYPQNSINKISNNSCWGWKYPVKPGERYRISGTVYANVGLYNIVDENNIIIDYFSNPDYR